MTLEESFFIRRFSAKIVLIYLFFFFLIDENFKRIYIVFLQIILIGLIVVLYVGIIKSLEICNRFRNYFDDGDLTMSFRRSRHSFNRFVGVSYTRIYLDYPYS